MGYYYLKHSDTTFYGVPEEKKFPLDSRQHVMSAIKFFNYVNPKYERQLANRIKRMAARYDVKIEKPDNTNNRFYRYL